MRNNAPPPHKQDNGLDPTHKAMAQRMHRENDHDGSRPDERITARGDGNRFPCDADDCHRPEASREAHPERPVDERSLAEDRVHSENDPQRRRHDDAGDARRGKKGEQAQKGDDQAGRYGLQYYSDDDRRGYGAAYRRAHNDHSRYDRGVHDLQKDGSHSRD
ncbi:MAG: hypothetical protein JF615_10590 [Asticcacaulis sp.]|nr:hypothetical protein [Asticcacaulis sp.]